MCTQYPGRDKNRAQLICTTARRPEFNNDNLHYTLVICVFTNLCARSCVSRGAIINFRKPLIFLPRVNRAWTIVKFVLSFNEFFGLERRTENERETRRPSRVIRTRSSREPVSKKKHKTPTGDARTLPIGIRVTRTTPLL